MTIQEVLSLLNEVKPHSTSEEVLVRWISECDGLVYDEVMKGHAGAPQAAPAQYAAGEDMDTELLVPHPYNGIYLHYLCAKIDFYNNEIGRFNNAMLMFNAALQEFANEYNRTHMARQVPLKVW